VTAEGTGPRRPVDPVTRAGYELDEFPDDGQAPGPSHPYPKEFVVDYVRGSRPTGAGAAPQ
jgi:hypothetical protein